MPRRTDLKKILLFGSGPIVIGQACEFDYSGSQACKALREEGYQVALVNSNPATIMTDPEFSDRTYIEPLVPEIVTQIMEIERPDAVLPTLGGQTALNLAKVLDEQGVFARLGIELIGASAAAIHTAEDRGAFKTAMSAIGLDQAESRLARTMDEAWAALDALGLPVVIRPAYTLGGSGGGLAFNREEFEDTARTGLRLSPVHEILIEEAVLGWKEYELEVMRDRADHCVIVCGIENFDPMGVHTGDSITVAPIQTLTDKEYQRMRDAAFRCIRAIGVETGGANIQFAVNPADGRMIIIEMNPRVSRSSALASKATGFPIAKIAAQLAVGYRLDELPNDITRETPACFEPTLDYVVVKYPRFAFEKFPGAAPLLGTQMKSVGEAMAIGRTFPEALQKAIRSLELGRFGLGADGAADGARFEHAPEEELRGALQRPTPARLDALRAAFLRGMSVEEAQRLTGIDPWFLRQVFRLVDFENTLRALGDWAHLDDETLARAKRLGFADRQLAHLFRRPEEEVRADRLRRGIAPTYGLVDTCAAEFAAYTPYYYASFEDEGEAPMPAGAAPGAADRPDRPTIVILGGGPNRIGQGIEFDYCCVHASFALRALGYRTVMVNSNPETVSTDYDTSDLLFFEPLTLEDVLAVCDAVRPVGVIVQFGGQTPLNLARALAAAGVPIIGTPVDQIDEAEDRERFQALIERCGLKQPTNGTATSFAQAQEIARRIGYPVIVRPSYVLGGRAMEIVYADQDLRRYMEEAARVSPDHPILIDHFLEEATEVDVDALADGADVVIGGVMEHIEEAGVHSGDSTCTLPPYSLPARLVGEIRRQTAVLARALGVRGLMNVQFAVQSDEVYVLEVNPRASRTVPFVSKATGRPLAKFAAQIMAGKTLAELGVRDEPPPAHVSVKAPVFPYSKFQGTDILLGPEMRSTGEVMGVDTTFGRALAKALLAAGQPLPTGGRVFVSVRDADKRAILFPVQKLHQLGFEIVSTRGTARVLERNGIPVTIVPKIHEGRPHVLDLIKDGTITMVINTPAGRVSRADEIRIRREAFTRGLCLISTIPGAHAASEGIEALQRGAPQVHALQDLHRAPRRTV